jgi:hypothetical protein
MLMFGAHGRLCSTRVFTHLSHHSHRKQLRRLLLLRRMLLSCMLLRCELLLGCELLLRCVLLSCMLLRCVLLRCELLLRRMLLRRVLLRRVLLRRVLLRRVLGGLHTNGLRRITGKEAIVIVSCLGIAPVPLCSHAKSFLICALHSRTHAPQQSRPPRTRTHALRRALDLRLCLRLLELLHRRRRLRDRRNRRPDRRRLRHRLRRRHRQRLHGHRHRLRPLGNRARDGTAFRPGLSGCAREGAMRSCARTRHRGANRGTAGRSMDEARPQEDQRSAAQRSAAQRSAPTGMGAGGGGFGGKGPPAVGKPRGFLGGGGANAWT